MANAVNGEAGVVEPVREKCPDCGYGIGQEHHDMCDVARCLWTGLQRLSCGAFSDREVGHECGLDIWSGFWPGVKECEEFGWFALYADGGTLREMHDLNRLAREGVWDREAQRWTRQRRRMG